MQINAEDILMLRDSRRKITPFRRRRNLITKWATVSKFRSSIVAELQQRIIHFYSALHPSSIPPTIYQPSMTTVMKNILLANSITIFIKLVPPFEQEQILLLLPPSVKCETTIKSSPLVLAYCTANIIQSKRKYEFLTFSSPDLSRRNFAN